MQEPEPEAVLFDLDRTLCESTQDFAAVLEAAFAEVGIEPYCTVEDTKAVVSQTPEVDSDREFFTALFDLAAERVGAGEMPSQALAAAYESKLDHSQVTFRAGAERALDHARSAASVGLVTNGGRETQTTKLDALGIRDAFDVTVFCDPAAGIPPKPDPTPIQQALDALDVDPEATLFVGDSKTADVAGAHAVGARSVWVPYDDSCDDDALEPHHTLDELHELEQLLE